MTHKSADTIGGGTDGVAELIGQANGVGESVMAQANGVKEVAAETAEKAEMAAKAVKDAVVEATSGATAKISAITNGTLESLTESTASASAATALEPVDEPQAQASSSRLFGSTSTFAPTLPEALPTPSANVLPANRKRKTPQDFTPSGPGATVASSSPSKLVVKFEDGVAPGQGWEGERTMIQVKKKDRNAIERTVWTFIMIGGFISQ